MDKFNFHQILKLFRSIIKEFIDSYRKNNIYNNLTFLDIGGRIGIHTMQKDLIIKFLRLINLLKIYEYQW